MGAWKTKAEVGSSRAAALEKELRGLREKVRALLQLVRATPCTSLPFLHTGSPGRRRCSRGKASRMTAWWTRCGERLSRHGHCLPDRYRQRVNTVSLRTPQAKLMAGARGPPQAAAGRGGQVTNPKDAAEISQLRASVTVLQQQIMRQEQIIRELHRRVIAADSLSVAAAADEY